MVKFISLVHVGDYLPMVQFIHDFILKKSCFTFDHMFLFLAVTLEIKKRLSFPEYASKEKLQFFIKEQLL